ncbi:cytochrome c biogenesis CcdA family protein [Clostridium sp. Marseille-P299]|uniref:cytochrome c biogenesis CcdA family protein n=1 Tax=Clostridium sp. Marseille-P299 TaxID=1805477 RepID=UPI0008374E4A|nr:cytochrome c biogenesis protein CcdA [Clostridium sp. Marseille-P299]
MEYIIVFLEGIITFISPCLLPMLPIYISYFAGQKESETKKKTLRNAFGFVLGFTIVFICLGAFAGFAGKVLWEYQSIVNVVLGIIMILFGLNFMNVIRIPNFHGKQISMNKLGQGFLSSVLFGIIFSIGWTPCVGAFLGSALMLATQSGGATKGIIMLLLYSIGLGIPFVLSAVLIEYFKGIFGFIKRNYKTVQTISGGLLIVIGILMMTGRLGILISMLSR